MNVNWNVVASPAILAADITFDDEPNLDIGVARQARDLERVVAGIAGGHGRGGLTGYAGAGRQTNTPSAHQFVVAALVVAVQAPDTQPWNHAVRLELRRILTLLTGAERPPFPVVPGLVADRNAPLIVPLLISEPAMLLFVSVSVVARPTKVSVEVGSVSVPTLTMVEITGAVSVLLVSVSVVALPTIVSLLD